MQISPALLDKINKAETDLALAMDADTATAVAKLTADTAITAEDAAKEAATAAHSTATTSAMDAIAALKVELGITP